MKKTWRVKSPDLALQKTLSSELKISTITAQLLVNRGVTDVSNAADFFRTSLALCADPFLMKGMDRAVERIKNAIRNKEKILVYGDYDVDGITSVAIVVTALKALGADAQTYIPNRLEEGYGLNTHAVKRADLLGIKLIVTVDCGITSFKEVAVAKASGIDIVITDHHELHEGKVPDAYAVINPLQGDCRYPFKHLAGVGIAYKLAKAVYDDTAHFAEDFLDLVCLGTVADVAPLVGENRTLVKYGLSELNKRGRPGLRALIDAAGLAGKELSSGHIGFALGPRINAMGRIGSPEKALELILTTDDVRAAELAKVLSTENRNRQKLEGGILEEALAKVEREVNFKHHRVIVLAGENWHQGVIGICASRIADRYYRPTILISLNGKTGKGSGRSIENFHLFNYLLQCKDLLAAFGGHESACGLTIDADRVDEFRERINAEVAKTVDESIFSPAVDIEAEIQLSGLSEAVIAEIESLSPFGEMNPQPVLASTGLVVKDGPRFIGKNGFKIWVTDQRTTVEAVSFGRGNFDVPRIGSRVDLAYVPSINEWQGVRSIQLELRDIRERGLI